MDLLRGFFPFSFQNGGYSLEELKKENESMFRFVLLTAKHLSQLKGCFQL